MPEAPPLQSSLGYARLEGSQERAARDWRSPDSIWVHRPVGFPERTLHEITPGMTNGEWQPIIQCLEH